MLCFSIYHQNNSSIIAIGQIKREKASVLLFDVVQSHGKGKWLIISQA